MSATARQGQPRRSFAGQLLAGGRLLFFRILTRPHHHIAQRRAAFHRFVEGLREDNELRARC